MRARVGSLSFQAVPGCSRDHLADESGWQVGAEAAEVLSVRVGVEAAQQRSPRDLVVRLCPLQRPHLPPRARFLPRA